MAVVDVARINMSLASKARECLQGPARPNIKVFPSFSRPTKSMLFDLILSIFVLQSMSLNLSEDQNSLIRAKEAIDLERENLRTDARTLANLRSEHARLKDDFRSLFTSNERIKSDYCTLQTDYKVRQ